MHFTVHFCLALKSTSSNWVVKCRRTSFFEKVHRKRALLLSGMCFWVVCVSTNRPEKSAATSLSCKQWGTTVCFCIEIVYALNYLPLLRALSIVYILTSLATLYRSMSQKNSKNAMLCLWNSISSAAVLQWEWVPSNSTAALEPNSHVSRLTCIALDYKLAHKVRCVSWKMLLWVGIATTGIFIDMVEEQKSCANFVARACCACAIHQYIYSLDNLCCLQNPSAHPSLSLQAGPADFPARYSERYSEQPSLPTNAYSMLIHYTRMLKQNTS